MLDLPRLIALCNSLGVMDPDPQRPERYVFKCPWGHYGAPTRIQAALWALVDKPTFLTDACPVPIQPHDHPVDPLHDLSGMCVHPTATVGHLHPPPKHHNSYLKPVDMEGPRDAHHKPKTINPGDDVTLN